MENNPIFTIIFQLVTNVSTFDTLTCFNTNEAQYHVKILKFNEYILGCVREEQHLLSAGRSNSHWGVTCWGPAGRAVAHLLLYISLSINFLAFYDKTIILNLSTALFTVTNTNIIKKRYRDKFHFQKLHFLSHSMFVKPISFFFQRIEYFNYKPLRKRQAVGVSATEVGITLVTILTLSSNKQL